MNHITPIQFGYITVQGKKFPVKFGTSQARAYCKRENCTFEDFNNLFKPDQEGKANLLSLQTDGSQIVSLVFTALEQGARVIGEPFEMSDDDVCDFIDILGKEPDGFTSFFAIINDGGDLLPNGQGEKTKKKKATP
jgi:hypothetical protein